MSVAPTSSSACCASGPRSSSRAAGTTDRRISEFPSHERTSMRARFSAIYTAALADILAGHGHHEQTLPPTIRPLERGMRLAGEAFTALGASSRTSSRTSDYDTSLRKVLQMLGDVPAGMSLSMPADTR